MSRWWALVLVALAAASRVAIAIDVAGAPEEDEEEPPVTAAELRGFMRTTTNTLATHGVLLAKLDADIAKLDADIATHGVLLATHGESLAKLDADIATHGVLLATHGESLAELGESLATHGELLAELAESAVTPTVAARVEACARTTTVFVLFENGDRNALPSNQTHFPDTGGLSYAQPSTTCAHGCACDRTGTQMICGVVVHESPMHGAWLW